MKQTIRVRKDGMLEWLSPSQVPIPIKGKETKRRFSEIVPRNLILRFCFRLLRLAFGEQGKVYEWTKTWRCHWRCTILMGKHRGETRDCIDRPYLLEWERTKWFTPLCDL